VRHPGLDRGSEERAGLGGVVVVVLQRVLDRFRHDDRPGEVHDRADPLFGEDAGEQRAILDVAFVERHAVGDGEAEARGQVVDDADGHAPVRQREDRMAADVAGAAGDENGRKRHLRYRSVSCGSLTRASSAYVALRRRWQCRAASGFSPSAS